MANKRWAWFLVGEVSGVLFASALAAAICWANHASTRAAALEQARISAGEVLSNIESHRSARDGKLEELARVRADRARIEKEIDDLKKRRQGL